MRNSTLQRRLGRLEAKARIASKQPTRLVVSYVRPNGHFGGEDCDSHRADAAGRVWDRAPGETKEDFERRVMADVPRRHGFPTVLYFLPTKEA
jgi:hypothetical protein